MPAGIYWDNNLLIDTQRGPSPAIWDNLEVARLLENPRLGQHFYDDFNDGCWSALGTNGEKAAGRWSAFVANNASAVLGTAADTTNLPQEGGVLGLTVGSNNNLSISLAAGNSAFRLISPATGFPFYQKLWFEASIAVSSVSSGAFDLFVGLMDTGDSGTRITSAADLVFSAADTIKTTTSMGGCLGFHKRATTNPSDVGIVHNVNNGTAQYLGGATNIQKLSLNYATNDSAHAAVGQAMAALSTTNRIAKAIGDTSGGSFLKLGFVVDGSAQNQPIRCATALAGQTAGTIYKPVVQFFVNGKVLPIFYDAGIVQASTFSSSFMAPVIGFRSGGSGAGVAYVDFVRVAALANI